jgi:hypothetical protein
MAYVIKQESAERPLMSPLSLAPLDRAKDTLALARMGSPAMRREWNTFAAESPAMARLVVKWLDADQAKAAKATREADRALERAEFVTKGKKPDGYCQKCQAPMKTKWPRCRDCGARNRFHPKGSVMKPKKARKAAQPMLTKSQVWTLALGTGQTVRSRGEAVRADLTADLDSPDPGRRMAAQAALRKLG